MAQVDMFLKVDDVQGESTDSKHAKEIEVLGFSWGASQGGSASSGGGQGTGKVIIQDLVITKYTDKSTTTLMNMCHSGTPFKLAKLTCRKAGGKSQVEYLVITMKEGIVSSLTHSSTVEDGRATEQLTLNFAIVQVDYTPQNQDGTAGATASTSWNVRNNAPS